MNKVNSKVDLRVDLRAAREWIRDPKVFEELKRLGSNRINKDMELVFQSDRLRTQTGNLEDCLNRLLDLLKEAETAAKGPAPPSIETKARVQKHIQADTQRRRTQKTFQSDKRASRQRPKAGDW